MFTEPYIIGDRLNASNASVRVALERGNTHALASLAERQIANGAAALDICACTAGLREAEFLRLIVSACPSVGGDAACCIDTQDAAIVSEVRPLLSCPPILNCYSAVQDASSDMQRAVIYARPVLGVIALCLNFRGPRASPERRVEAARRMVIELAECGVAPLHVIFDAVTVPSASNPGAEEATLETIRLLRAEFRQSGILCAVSNYSFGLRKRRAAERSYVERARAAGATVFLMNALDRDLCRAATGGA